MENDSVTKALKRGEIFAAIKDSELRIAEHINGTYSIQLKVDTYWLGLDKDGLTTKSEYYGSLAAANAMAKRIKRGIIYHEVE